MKKLIILLGFIFILTGCNSQKQAENIERKKEKISSEYKISGSSTYSNFLDGGYKLNLKMENITNTELRLIIMPITKNGKVVDISDFKLEIIDQPEKYIKIMDMTNTNNNYKKSNKTFNKTDTPYEYKLYTPGSYKYYISFIDEEGKYYKGEESTFFVSVFYQYNKNQLEGDIETIATIKNQFWLNPIDIEAEELIGIIKKDFNNIKIIGYDMYQGLLIENNSDSSFYSLETKGLVREITNRVLVSNKMIELY